jgi:succinate dehydrogenase / fumarate reductase membrane anchor subunit
MPAGGFERFAWFFMRASGLVLLLLALGHLTIMHLINSIDDVDYAFVAARYATPFWRTYDGLMLTLALLHGYNGLRVVLTDYLKGGWRLFVNWALGFLTLLLLILGLYVVFAFQPPSPETVLPNDTDLTAPI